MTGFPPVHALGIAWYRRQDYPRIREIMADRHTLPPTYDGWSKAAERIERDQKGRGVVVVRAVVDPEQFPAWCRDRGLDVDAKARMAFANEVARDTILAAQRNRGGKA